MFWKLRVFIAVRILDFHFKERSDWKKSASCHHSIVAVASIVKMRDCVSVAGIVKMRDCVTVASIVKMCDCESVASIVQICDCVSVASIVKMCDCVTVASIVKMCDCVTVCKNIVIFITDLSFPSVRSISEFHILHFPRKLHAEMTFR